MRLFNRRPGFREVPKGAVMISPEDSGMIRQLKCPRCGKAGGLFYAGSIYEVGKATDVYRCCNEIHGKVCGQKVYSPYPRPDILWVSENGKWTIQSEGVSHTGAVNILVTDEGMYSNRYTLYADGSVLRDNEFIPGYVDDAVRTILENIRKGMR